MEVLNLKDNVEKDSLVGKLPKDVHLPRDIVLKRFCLLLSSFSPPLNSGIWQGSYMSSKIALSLRRSLTRVFSPDWMQYPLISCIYLISSFHQNHGICCFVPQ